MLGPGSGEIGWTWLMATSWNGPPVTHLIVFWRFSGYNYNHKNACRVSRNRKESPLNGLMRLDNLCSRRLFSQLTEFFTFVHVVWFHFNCFVPEPWDSNLTRTCRIQKGRQSLQFLDVKGPCSALRRLLYKISPCNGITLAIVASQAASAEILSHFSRSPEMAKRGQ